MNCAVWTATGVVGMVRNFPKSNRIIQNLNVVGGVDHTLELSVDVILTSCYVFNVTVNTLQV